MPNCLDILPVDQPKAIVILFSWLGGQLKHLRKYAQEYNKRGCTCIIACGDVTALMITYKRYLADLVNVVTHEAAKLLRRADHDGIPLVTHSFSGGGTVLQEIMEQSIAKAREADAAGTVHISADLTQAYLAVGEAYSRGSQIFDSCPAYLHIQSGLRGVASAVQQPVLRIMIQAVFLLYIAVNVMLSFLSGRDFRPQEHWKHVQNQTICLRQAFVYSASDHITDHMEIDKLIEYRQAKWNVKILAIKKFDDSPHVMHFRKYPKEYVAFVDEVLQKTIHS